MTLIQKNTKGELNNNSMTEDTLSSIRLMVIDLNQVKAMDSNGVDIKFFLDIYR